jgi:DNA-binding CsgD family transcriptional regulator
MNRSAEKVISDQTLLSSRSGDIRALDAPSAQRWRTTLRHCVGTGQSGTCLMRDVRGAFWMVQASVLRNEIRQEVEDQLVEGDAETLVLVVLHPSANLADAQSQALAEAFGLTAREAELAMELAQGLDLRQAAKNLKIKLAAARSHLKAVFSKTGVTRQAALVAMIVGILAAHH